MAFILYKRTCTGSDGFTQTSYLYETSSDSTATDVTNNSNCSPYDWGTTVPIYQACDSNGDLFQVFQDDAPNDTQVRRENITGGCLLTFTISNITTTTCNGATDGSATVTPSRDDGPVQSPTYTYRTGSHTGPIVSTEGPIATNLPGGTLYLTVSDNSGQQVQDTLTIPEPPPVVVSGTITNVTCNGSTNGTVSITSPAEEAGTTYRWYSVQGQTETEVAQTYTLGNQGAGLYRFRLTNSLGCVAEADFEITEPDPLAVTVTVTIDTATAAVTGGTSPYTYTWQDASQSTIGTGPSITGLAAGNYFLVITDANLCQSTQAFIVPEREITFADNLITHTATTGTAQTNHYFKCNIMVDTDYTGTYTNILTLTQPVVNLQTQFSINEALRTQLQQTLPSLTATTAQLATGHYLRYRVEVAERYGTPPTDQPFVQADVKTAVLGGLDPYVHAEGTFWDAIATANRFFTWQPTTRTVYLEQYGWLHFYVYNTQITTLQLRANVTYTNGTTVTGIPVLPTITGVTFDTIYRLPCGLPQISAAFSSTLTVSSYTLTLYNGTGSGATAVSNTLTYTLTNTPGLHLRQFLFLNSLGGWDVLAFASTTQGTITPQSTLQDRPYRADYLPTQPRPQVVRKLATPTHQINAGYYNQAYYPFLQDFILSRDVYEITTRNHTGTPITPRLIPCRVSGTAPVYNSQNPSQPFDFTAQYNPTEHYSPIDGTSA